MERPDFTPPKCGDTAETGTGNFLVSTSSRTKSVSKISPMPTISVEETPQIFPTSKQISSQEKEGFVEDRNSDADKIEGNVRKEHVSGNGKEVRQINSSSEDDGESNGNNLGSRSHLKVKVDKKSEHNIELLQETSPTSFMERRETKSLGPSLRRRRPRRNSRNIRKALSEEGRLNEIQAEDLENCLKALAAAFSERTERTKKRIEQPPTPSSEESDSDELKPGEPTLLDRLRQLASPGPSEFGDSRRKSISHKLRGTCQKNLDLIYDMSRCNYILDPQSSVYIGWLMIVAFFFAYNACVIPLRVVFPYQTESNELIWFIFDSIADVVYLIDVIAFKPHVKFIQNGFWVKEPKEAMKTYVGSLQFKIDMISVFPADIFANYFFYNMPALRVLRILKVETFWELFRQLDTYLAHPHRARIFHTCLYMLYMIHMVACCYYAASTWEGIGTTTWTFDGHGNAYVRCFYFATKTATSIGKNPKPENELEYLFMTCAWLSGVFVTAILIGQIRDIIATATKSQTEYRIHTSATVSYLHRLGVPRRLQDRVKLWLSYTWEQQKTLDETKILNMLPKSMKAEIALNIHVETLAKVKLFQKCETAFLRDLVVKLRSIIILPGDVVCRKGEIGREMFIVKSGRIHVIGGPNGSQILATLGEGSVFGEIALLGIGGMNKRTADVRAGGFVNLFVLNKADLSDVIRDYPEAQEILQRKAKKFMRENIKKARATPSPVGTSQDTVSLAEETAGVIIKNKSEPPQLIGAMLKLFPSTTKIGRYLRKGSRVSSTTDLSGINSDENVDKPEGHNMYTSLTSYPPSPFFPTSPGHISPELDISIMTGDSSDKRLSPPNEDSTSEISALFSDDNSYPSYPNPRGEIGEAVEISVSDTQVKNWDAFRVSPSTTSSSISSKIGRSVPFGDVDASNDDRVERCISPLPPFMRKEDIPKVNTRRSKSLIPSAYLGKGSSQEMESDEKKDGQLGKSCPHFETIGGSENRDDIPIQLRPPLYIIEPGMYGLETEQKTEPKKIKEGTSANKTLFISSSIESQDQIDRDAVPTPTSTEPSSSATRGISSVLSEKKAARQSVVGTSKSSSILNASRFIFKMRGTLQRQAEIVLDEPGKTEGNLERAGADVVQKSEYSLDIGD